MGQIPMRITFLLPGAPIGPGGGIRVVFEYANRLAARSHVVTILEPRQPAHGRDPGWREWLYRQLTIAARPWFGSVHRWQRVDPRVQILRVPALKCEHIPAADAIIATAWPTAELLAQCQLSKGRPLYLIQHYEDWGGSEDRVQATWRQAMTKIVVARWLVDLGAKMGVSDLVCIPNAIDQSVFRLTRSLEARPKRVAMMVSHLPIKGSNDGLAALQIVRKQHPDVEVQLFGKLPRFRHPAWMRYHWNPPISKLVSDIYNQARIFLCPSWSEGFGLPGAEAMACGCALVSTDCGGVREYAQPGENALLSPPRDVESLAKNVHRLLEDDHLRRRLAVAGTAKIAEFSWERNTDALEAVCGGRISAVQAEGATT